MGGSETITIRLLDRIYASFSRRLADFLGVEDGARSKEALELERRVGDLRARLGKAAAARHLIERERAENDARDDIEEKAEFAISEGRDDLARAAMRYKSAIDERREEIARELAALDEEAAALEAALDVLKSGAREGALKAKVEELDRLFDEARRAAGEER